MSFGNVVWYSKETEREEKTMAKRRKGFLVYLDYLDYFGTVPETYRNTEGRITVR